MDTLAAKMAVKFKGIAYFSLNADRIHNVERNLPLLKKSRKYVKNIFENPDFSKKFFF